MTPMWTRWLFGATALAAATLGAQTETAAPANSSILSADLEADVRFLAGDGMRGRLTNTPGNQQAAEFIASRFARLGLSGTGQAGTHFQTFDLTTTQLGDINALEMGGEPNAELTLGSAFYPDPTSVSGTAAGEVVFAGFGITEEPIGHDDYRSADLEGKVALILNHEPEEFDPDSVFEGEVPSEASRTVRKVLAAQHGGATAVLIAPDLHNHVGRTGLSRPMRNVWPGDRPGQRPRYQLASWVNAVRIPVMHISGDLATLIVERAGYSLHALGSLAERPGGIEAFAIPGPPVTMTASVTRRTVTTRNVLGLIHGSDPQRREEWILLTAHFDHEGADGSRIFNGADDNASGVAGLIEIAEAYQLAEQEGFRPQRSILFAAWNAEEQGLLGAWAYTQAPLHPLEQTVAVLNMDMIGRNEEIPEAGGPRFRGLEPQTAEVNQNAVNLLGYSRSPELRGAVERANGLTGLRLQFRYDDSASNLLRRSDQWPFLYLGVPAIFVHTGLHPDYHTERDRPESLNYEKMARIVRMVHQTSWNLSQTSDRPAVVRR